MQALTIRPEGQHVKTVYETIVEMLPAIRAAIARELVGSYGMGQAQVAEVLAISQPAVSQYLNAVRGGRTEAWMQKPEFEAILKETCERLATGKATILTELPSLVRRLREKGIICSSCDLKDRFCGHCMEI